MKSVLDRVPPTRLLAGTDWVSRVGPPFLPYGVVFGVQSAEENPYPPSVPSMIDLLRRAGADEVTVERIACRNAIDLLKLELP